ncbi:MAG: sulfite exporter TauE/SafE family protein [Rectinemataceae bacterium]|jgi:hypothetical protein
MTPSLASYAAAAGAAIAAGAINALAGGGTLITFPVLLALGLPAVSANVTNTVALLPGYLGGAWAQSSILLRTDQRRRLALFVPVALAGGLAGAILLIVTDEKAFRALVPYLILLAAALLAFGDRIKRLLALRSVGHPRPRWMPGLASASAMAIAAVYGGYFGAGLSVIILAVLGIALDDPLSELNASKQAISLACNLAAAVLFAFSGKVDWIVAAVMAVSALAGGVLGGLLAGKIKSSVLRSIVVGIGIAVGVYYLICRS